MVRGLGLGDWAPGLDLGLGFMVRGVVLGVYYMGFRVGIGLRLGL
jgi:hypothetical protein